MGDWSLTNPEPEPERQDGEGERFETSTFQILSGKDKRDAARSRDLRSGGQLRLVQEMPAEHKRPQKRGECQGFETCPYVGCRHNTAVAVQRAKTTGDPQIWGHHPQCWDGDYKLKDYGDRVFNPDREEGPRVEDMPHTCALNFVEAHPGGATQDEVAEALGTTRARVSQIEQEAMGKIALDLARAVSAYNGQEGDTDEVYELAERIELNPELGGQILGAIGALSNRSHSPTNFRIGGMT
ncbi:MAG: sigma factor-like helix-turn-helix DNA-binding protein [Myxococcota bacterium]